MLVMGQTRRWKLLVPAAVTLTGLLALGGCTLVSDHLTGVELSVSSATTCAKDCNDSFKIAYDEEQKRHVEEVEACKSFEGEQRENCLQAEAARHAAAMEALSEAKVECQTTCHRQGSVTAG